MGSHFTELRAIYQRQGLLPALLHLEGLGGGGDTDTFSCRSKDVKTMCLPTLGLWALGFFPPKTLKTISPLPLQHCVGCEPTLTTVLDAMFMMGWRLWMGSTCDPQN